MDFWPLAYAFWLLAFGLVAGNQVMSEAKTVGQTDQETKSLRAAMLTQSGASYAIGVKRLMAKRKLTSQDVNKIDFSLPGTDEYEKNKKMNIYSPEGGQMENTLSDYSKVSNDDSKFIFSLVIELKMQEQKKLNLLAFFLK